PSVGGVRQHVITDDLALVVDGAVARLVKRNQQMGDFVWAYYGYKHPAMRVGREAGMSERKGATREEMARVAARYRKARRYLQSIASETDEVAEP
ncbi:hypothetical protein ACFCVU_29170, partial [Peribacillus butanolivorans]|uniref:hypothetical protein n=1 Tax=Peribacillus butanolivorans TaxID=421767 RepID=UPI0035DF5FB9